MDFLLDLDRDRDFFRRDHFAEEGFELNLIANIKNIWYLILLEIGELKKKLK